MNSLRLNFSLAVGLSLVAAAGNIALADSALSNSATVDSSLANYRQQAFSLPAEIESIILADTNNDGLKDIVANLGKEIRIYFQDTDGFDFVSGFDSVELPGSAIGWDISYGYARLGSPGGFALIALIDGSEALAWTVSDSHFDSSQVLIGGLQGFLGKGVSRLHFSRDINGDGIDDLIIPGAGVLKLLLDNGDGSYQDSLSINSDIQMRTTLSSDRLERRTGQSIRIPLMNMRDVNSDGFDDLVTRSRESIQVFIAQGNSSPYFNSSPSYVIDLAAIEARLGGFDFDKIDFSNLTGLLALTHEEIFDDVDMDGYEDLLLREGGKVSLFAGLPNGMDLEQPRQVLRSGGNVVSSFLFDENEDGLKDLWIWRVETISVGDIFLWLALSGSISVEAFIYPNEGEKFARRPSRKITVALKFPSVISLAGTANEIQDLSKQAQQSGITPSASANIDSNMSSQDVLVLLNNRLEIFLNSVSPKPEQEDENLYWGALDYSRDKDEYEINIRQIINDLTVIESPELRSIAGKTADVLINLNTDIKDGDIITLKLNDDELDDVFIFTHHDSTQYEGLLLLSKETD
ncbi:MAG: hypothetical protein COC19_05345 [SAR86 cluster bacterium]|uniref:VCBS repeat-containing protein n=1 Tax=SAR86 cluster bacterium TaxID=2030880 RepID=A0A2A4MM82_9GAMM|nr:MAG: hypothetical protein COC19_05345 [SAR86 cluster bacterium]